MDKGGDMKQIVELARRHGALGAIIFVFMLLGVFRVTLHADVYDEIFNLSVSYRVALGQIPFYECWEAYQGGDLFLAPFLWVYIKLVGTSSGIILYSRFIYLLWLAGCACIVYKAIKPLLGPSSALAIAASCVLFSIHSLFYLWYDTVAVILLLAGCFSIYGAVSGSMGGGWATFGASLHGLMVLAYPSMILVTILSFIIVVLVCFRRHKINVLVRHIIGSLIALTIGMAIILYISVDNFTQTIKIITSYRSAVNTASNIAYDVIKAYVKVNKYSVAVGAVLLVAGYFVFIANRFKRAYLIAIVALPLVCSLFVEDQYKGLLNYASFVGLWAPLLFFLYSQQDERTELVKRAGLTIPIVWLPSCASVLSVAMSTVYAEAGPVKAWEGMFAAALVSLVMITLLWLDSQQDDGQHSATRFRLPLAIRLRRGEGASASQSRIVRQFSDVRRNLPALLFSGALLVNSYSYYYLNASAVTLDDPVSRYGVYAGIRVKDNMIEWESVKPWLMKYAESNETILVSFAFNPIYLMTDMLPAVPSVESPTYYENGELKWDMTLEYFDTFDIYPDVMILSGNDLDNAQFQRLLQNMYTEVERKSFSWDTAVVYVRNR